MKTFEQIRREVISDVTLAESMGNDRKYTFLKIEELSAKEYAKHWLDEAAEVAMLQAEKGLPVGDAIFKLKDEIDKQ